MNLDELRHGIDQIDRQIIALLQQRYQLVGKVGEFKKFTNRPIYVPEREKMLLDKLLTINAGQLREATLRAIYREIISGAIQLEKPLTVGFCPNCGDFSPRAVRDKFGHGVVVQAFAQLSELLAAVKTNLINYAAVPERPEVWGELQNSTLNVIAEYTYGETSARGLVCGAQQSSPTTSDQTALIFRSSCAPETLVQEIWGDAPIQLQKIDSGENRYLLKVRLHRENPDFTARYPQFQARFPQNRIAGSYPIEVN